MSLARHAAWAAALAAVIAGAAPITLPFVEPFETDLSAWTVTGDATTLSVSHDVAWSGAGSLKVAAQSGVSGYATQSTAAAVTGNSFVRLWLYVPVGEAAKFPAGGEVRILELRSGGAITTMAHLALRKELTGDSLLHLIAVYGAGANDRLGSNTTTLISEGTWHYVELAYRPLANHALLYIDDTQTYAASDLNIGSLTFDGFTVGPSVPAGATTTFYLDDVGLNGGSTADRLGTTLAGSSVHHDEFGSTGLVVGAVPPGKSGVRVASGTADLSLGIEDTTSPHRGRYLRATDTNGTLTSASFNAVAGWFTPRTDAAVVYHRAWWRPSAPGERTVLGLYQGNTTTPSSSLAVAAARISDNGALDLVANDGAWLQSTSPAAVSTGAWHLLELVVQQATGERSLYLDGDLVGSITRPISGALPDLYAHGQLWTTAATSSTFAGTDDFDDARTAHAVQPSTLAVASPGPLAVGACAPVTVKLITSAGMEAPAPEPVSVSLGAARGNWTSSCLGGMPVTGVSLGAGRTSAAMWYQAVEAGQETLQATHADYLPGTATFAIQVVAEPTAVVLTLPSTARAGVPVDLTVEVLTGTARAGDFRGTVSFSATVVAGGDPLLPDSYTFTAEDAGLHTFAGGATFPNAGTYGVKVQTSGSGSSLSDEASIQVVAYSPPEASLSAAPLVGTAPLQVTFDAAASTVDPSATSPQFAFDFGDGSFTAASTERTVQHAYNLPGGYLAAVTVSDGMGGADTATAQLQVKDRDGKLPPTAVIHTTGPTQGTVQFGCDCQSPNGGPLTYVWLFGDGAQGAGEAPSHQYLLAGRYTARLAVVDAAGMWATAEAEVVIPGPTPSTPLRCAASSTAGTAGQAPFSTTLVGTSDTTTTDITWQWIVDGGLPTPGATLAQTFQAGWHVVRLVATTSAGARCEDTLLVTAYGAEGVLPPKIVSVASTTGFCGSAYAYDSTGKPRAAGTAPLSWSVSGVLGDAPGGMTVDPGTGEVKWIPTPSQKGKNPYMLTVTGEGGVVDRQLVEVMVECVPPELGTCGCASSGLGGPLLAALALGMAGRRRRARR